MAVKKTVLLFPINAVGHIHALLAIADRLKKENYRTVYLTVGPTIDIIKDHGHELVEVGEKDVYEEQVEGRRKVFPGYQRWPAAVASSEKAFSTNTIESLRVIMDILGSAVTNGLVENHGAIEAAIEMINPDLIILDHMFAPLCIIKNQDRRPWVNMWSPNPLGLLKAARADGVRPPNFMGLKLLSKADRLRQIAEEPDQWEQQLQHWKEQTELVDGIFANKLDKFIEFNMANGLQLDQIFSYSPHLNIYLCPKAIDYDHDEDILVYPPRWIRCDSLVRNPIGKQDLLEIQYWSKRLEEAMKGKKEMIYFSLGSIASGRASLVQKYIDFLNDDLDRLYVVSKGVDGDSLKLNSANMIGANYLPQIYFLERAKLVVIHGGNNSVTESMYFGKPMIVLPMFADQMDNAQRIDDFGLGCRLDLHHCTKRDLRGAIERLSSDTRLLDKMRLLGEEMRSRDDLDRVAPLITTLIDKKRLDEAAIDAARK